MKKQKIQNKYHLKYDTYLVFKDSRLMGDFHNKRDAIHYASQIYNGIVFKNLKTKLDFIYSD